MDQTVGEQQSAKDPFVKADQDQIAQGPDADGARFAGEDAGLPEMSARTNPADDTGAAVLALEDHLGVAHGDHIENLAFITLAIGKIALRHYLHPAHLAESREVRDVYVLKEDRLLQVFFYEFFFHFCRLPLCISYCFIL